MQQHVFVFGINNAAFTATNEHLFENAFICENRCTNTLFSLTFYTEQTNNNVLGVDQ